MRKKAWITSLMLSGVLVATSVSAAEIDLVNHDDMAEETLDQDNKEEKEENYKTIGEKTENAFKIFLTNNTDKIITGLSIRGIMDMNFSDNLMEEGQEWLPGEEVIFWCDPAEVQNLEAFEIPDEDSEAMAEDAEVLDPEMEDAEAVDLGETEETDLDMDTASDLSESEDVDLLGAEDTAVPNGELDDLSDDADLDSVASLEDFEMIDDLEDFDDYMLDDMDDMEMLYDDEMMDWGDDMDDMLDDMVEVYDICLEFKDGDSATLHEIPLEQVYQGSIVADEDFMYLEYREESSDKKYSTQSVEELYMGILTDLDEMDDLDDYDDMMDYEPMDGYDIDYSYGDYGIDEEDIPDDMYEGMDDILNVPEEAGDFEEE